MQTVSRLAALPKKGVLVFAILFLLASLQAAEPVAASVRSDVFYKTDATTDYEKERCHLDLYLPKTSDPFPTLVWFHGGGLENGDKAGGTAVAIARRLNAHGIGFASVNYRLSPKAGYPAYIEDAAASVAWVRKHIAAMKGDPHRVFVSGHSAGGYLTAMVGLDPHYLAAHGLKPADMAGYIPISGQMVTHSTVRKERGIPRTQPVIDDAAPSFHVNSDVSPFLNLCAENDLASRAEENVYFVAALKAAGGASVRLLQIMDRDHGSVAGRVADEGDPALVAMLEFMNSVPPSR